MSKVWLFQVCLLDHASLKLLTCYLIPFFCLKWLTTEITHVQRSEAAFDFVTKYSGSKFGLYVYSNALRYALIDTYSGSNSLSIFRSSSPYMFFKLFSSMV